MAGIEIKGFEELRRNTEHLQKIIADDAIRAAEMAAAKVIRDAVQAAAPRSKAAKTFRELPQHPSGQLAASIKIFKGRSKALTTTGQASKIGRLLIGPEKKAGFYGYFREKGRAGFTLGVKKAKALHWIDKEGKDRFAKSVKVGAQPERPWMEPITKSVEAVAQEAGREAFEQVLNRNLK